jgi:Na+-transporting NADH:ubiquinone oxidoreductase subunit NqrB
MTLPKLDPPPAPPGANAPGSPKPASSRVLLGLRLLVTALLVALYVKYHVAAGEWLNARWTALAGAALKPATLAVLAMSALIALLLAVWWRLLARDKRLHAPVLITTILAVGDAAYGILETHHLPSWMVSLTAGRLTSYSPTFVAILITIGIELLAGRFFHGKWPFLASAYISGISLGILVRSPALWPFILCALFSILSKYVLRIGNRHLWNPTNYGVVMILFLAPLYVAPLSVQAGNEVWAVLVIWLLGGMILYNLGLLHIPVTFVLTFIPLAFLRSWWTGDPWQAELAPITFPIFQLYIFFMITDPKTITHARWSQCLVAFLIGVVETVLRLAFKDVYSLLHALFIVGPIANVIEIIHDARHPKPAKAPAPAVGPVAAPPAPAPVAAGAVKA